MLKLTLLPLLALTPLLSDKCAPCLTSGVVVPASVRKAPAKESSAVFCSLIREAEEEHLL